MFKFESKTLDFAHKFDKTPRPAPDYEKHHHEFFEILYFVQGDATFTVEDRTYDLEPGDVVFIQPGEHHYVTFNPEKCYERYVLKFHETELPKRMFKKLQNRATFYKATEEMHAVFRDLDRIHEHFKGEDLTLLFGCRMLEIMILLCQKPELEKAVNRDTMITKIINYIGENLTERLSLADICKHFHFSQSYISNKFSNHMRSSIISYVRTKKILAAHREIVRGEKATAVAEKYGFSDYSTFYRSYVKVMGFSPAKNK